MRTRLKAIKRRLPTREQILGNPLMQVFREQLHDKNLWHLNRRSVSRATSIGLFCAYLPMPFEMLPAALGAIVFRANVPLAIAWVWISNPLTWFPLYAPAYLLGNWLLGDTAIPLEDAQPNGFVERLLALWVGCLIFGTIVSTAGYFAVQYLWRLKVMSSWRHRQERRARRRRKALKMSSR